ncbi:MAG: NADH:flavin oxidoreductase/NADH oxidase [Alphaproteobacteria bacterium]|nr:NADH:flavin oxidoreductase/NADH oxidase [Alphaproteobacteria bacterium]
MSTLFSPFSLRDITFANRVTIAPMCQYSAVDGTPGDWHQMHLGHLAISGAGLLICEATGVSAEGRISPNCTGLYSDENEAAFAGLVAFCRSIAPLKIGIQLGHAGRKGSTRAPWLDGGPLTEAEGAWQPFAPSPLPYLESWATPHALDGDGLEQVKADFVAAAQRTARIGFDLLELHAAHGYLLHQFLSPLSNRRDDGYGGSLDARMRFPLEVFEAVRAAFPADRPVTVRLSATDYVEGGWDLAQSEVFCHQLKDLGCDLVHVTSGGLDQRQEIVTGPGYQTQMAARIRQAVDIPTMAVGQITDPLQAETIVRTGQADLVALARGMLWDPRWVWRAALALDAELELPAPYARANPALRAKPFVKRT